MDQLKIDQPFVRDVLVDSSDAAISKSVMARAQSLRLALNVKGVETDAQRDFLAQHGCHAYQSYLFNLPLAIEEFEQFLTTSSGLVPRPA